MTTPLASAALRRLAPASLVGGKYVDDVTGRLAYYGPNGEPGTAQPTGQYTTAYRMPDGRVAYYAPGNNQYSDPSRNAGTGMGMGPSTSAPNLNPQLLASNGGTALPFDDGLADTQAALAAERARFESDAVAEQQRIEREALLARRETEMELPGAQRDLLEGYAGRGLAYSSGYAYDQADQQNKFANFLSQIDQQRTQGLGELTRQRGRFSDEWASRLQGAQAAAARRLAQRAGGLGLNDRPQANPGMGTPMSSPVQDIRPMPSNPARPATPGPFRSPATAPRTAPVKSPADLDRERRWAEYVKFNPTNARNVVLASRKRRP